MSIISKIVTDRDFQHILDPFCTRDPRYSFSEKFLLFLILAAILNFGGNQKCLIYEWLNSLYVRLYTVPSGDALRQIDAILVGYKTSNVKTTCRKSYPANVFPSVKFDL